MENRLSKDTVELFFRSRKMFPYVVSAEVGSSNKGKLPWPIYGSNLSHHNLLFCHVMDKPIEVLVAEVKSKKGSCYALEVCGEGSVLRDLPLLSGAIAITATDLRTPSEIALDSESNRQLIAKHILSGNTFKLIRQYLLENGIQGADLIVCRPLGGWLSIGGLPDVSTNDVSTDIEWLLTNKLYGLLNPDCGTLLMEYFDHADKDLSDWVRKLRETPGLNLNFSSQYHLLRVQRSLTAPSQLPRIPIFDDDYYIQRGLL